MRMNTGLVRRCARVTLIVRPRILLDGKWGLINFPPSTWGATGLLISTGWKQLMELAILERKADDMLLHLSPFGRTKRTSS